MRQSIGRDRRLTVELDTTYQPHVASGITTYTVAMAQELAESSTIRLVLLVSDDVPDGLYPAELTRRRLRRIDRVRVRHGRVRVIPQHMRPAPLWGCSVVTVHDLIHAGRWNPAWKRAVFAALLSLLRGRDTKILTDSQAVRSRLLCEGFRSESVRVYLPKLPRRSAAPTSAPPACGGGGLAVVGNLRPHKDVGTIVDAHALAARRGYAGRLHLVTSGSEEELARLQDRYPLELQSRFCVHRKVGNDERDAVLRHAEATVTASLDEGFGYALDESLAQGTLVIASAIPPHVENVRGRAVVLFPPGDVAALTDAILTLPLSLELQPISPRAESAEEAVLQLLEYVPGHD